MTRIFSLLCLCFLAVAGCAQEAPHTLPYVTKSADATSPPTLTSEQKLSIRDAQHKLDGIEKQQKDLTAQIQQLQSQIQTESQRLSKSYQDAKAALDKVQAGATAGVDEKKWKPDWETLTFTAVPVPAAPPNASTPKPVPGSPGAAAPPAQQAKK